MRLKSAMRWAKDNDVDLLAMTAAEAANLGESLPRSNASQRQLRIALRYFWELSGVDGPEKAIRVPPRPTPRWRGLEDNEVKSLLDIAAGDWPRGGVICLGLYLGLRRKEIATLRWSSFDDDLGWVRIQGKFDRTRDLPVHPRLQRMLAAARWPGDYVFPGRFGGHVTVATINNWVRVVGDQAGVDHLHPHRLRHTSGGKVNDKTGDIRAAQAWLGHSDVSTTQTYTRVTRDRLVRAMDTFDDWGDDSLPEATGAEVIPLRPARWNQAETVQGGDNA